jgi:hypothetical protein
MAQLRNALERPHHREISSPCECVSITHPIAKKPLLSLPAYILTPGSDAEYVIEYQLVMDACRVLTNGEGGDIHLVRSQDGTRVPSDSATLASGRYFLHLETAEGQTNYKVVTEFAAWKFLHDNLPLHWRRPRSEEAQ